MDNKFFYKARPSKSKKSRFRLRNSLIALAIILLFLIAFIPYVAGKVAEYKENGGRFTQVTEQLVAAS